MKLGIIVVFSKEHKSIKKEDFSRVLRQGHNFPICIVNNCCLEHFGEELFDISDGLDHVNVINLKRLHPTNLAVKAGVRFLKSHTAVRYFAYIDGLSCDEVLTLFVDATADLSRLVKADAHKTLMGITMSKKIFSLLELCDDISQKQSKIA